MRFSPLLLLLCLPLTGCPSPDPGGDDDGANSSTTTDDPPPGGDTSTTTDDPPPPPPDTDTDPLPPDTDTDTDPLPPDTDTDTDPLPPDTDTDTDTDTSGPIAGCECILDEVPVDQSSNPSAPTCGEAICPLVVGSCEDFCGFEVPFELGDPEALECALVALRDRTPGLVRWSFSEATGYANEDGYVLVNADGTAVRRRWRHEDLSFEVGDAVLGELPPPADFDACLAEPDDRARFDCLRAELAGSLEVCNEGWTCSECI